MYLGLPLPERGATSAGLAVVLVFFLSSDLGDFMAINSMKGLSRGGPLVL